MVDTRWVRSVGRVFQINPRIGSDADTIWISRSKEESILQRLLATPGKNICLDGPSGVGKTSLALTTIRSLDCPYIEIQLTRKTDWSGFCRIVIEKLRDPMRGFAFELQAGLKNFIPSVDLKILFSRKTSYADRLEAIDKIASYMMENDLAKWICEANCILMIDDFEKANNELLGRISDLTKILTQTCQSQNGKLLIVGTGDIYYQLYMGDKALESRLAEVSLGTLPDKSWSWRYLIEGFNKLGLFHPSNSKYVRSKQREDCINSVSQACDGLLKTLTELGSRVCLSKSPDAKSISVKSITTEAEKMPIEIFNKFKKRHPVIRKLLERDIECRRVIEALYKLGIGRIHSISELESQIQNDYQYDDNEVAIHVDRSIDELVDIEFIVRTGENRNIVYVTDPALAHNLGVAIAHGTDYGIPKEYSSTFGQLSLPMR